MKERLFNPNSGFENLARGVQARSKMIVNNLDVWISPEELPVDIPKKRARGLVLAFGSAVLAVAAIACGKAEAERKNNQTPTPAEPPIATRTVEPTPTQVKTPEPTPTPEPLPRIEDIEQLIDEGFSGITTYQYQQIPELGWRKPEEVKRTLRNCNTDGQMVVFSSRDIVKPGDPGYWSVRAGQCENFGAATKKLYEVTGRTPFLEANQAMKLIHYDVFKKAQTADPRIENTYWQHMLERVYNITPAK